MAYSVAFRAPVVSDIDALALTMRPIDRLECQCVSNAAPAQALARAVAESSWSLTADVDGRPVCMFGVAPANLLGVTGHPWLLAADGFEAFRRPFLMHSRSMIERMHEDFRTLTNIIHAENACSIRWLKWCGFAFGKEMKVSGEPFRQFFRHAEGGV